MKRNLKFIVLGGNGFIGYNLSRYILAKGHDITILDHGECRGELKEIHYEQVDFFDDDKLYNALLDKDIIIHAISTVNPGNSEENYMRGYSKDFVQTIKLCSWIKNTDKKLIFISSGGTIYGEHAYQPLSEDVTPKPINHYANIKLSIENALRIFRIQNNLKVIIARISNPYGPGQNYKKGVGFIDAVLKQAMCGDPVEIWGDGSCVRDYIFIEDVCEFLYKLAIYDGKEYVFNISSGVGVAQNEIVEIVKNLGISVNVKYKKARAVDVKKVILDNKRIQTICNLNLIPIREGIEKYYNYLLQEGEVI